MCPKFWNRKKSGPFFCSVDVVGPSRAVLKHEEEKEKWADLFLRKKYNFFGKKIFLKKNKIVLQHLCFPNCGSVESDCLQSEVREKFQHQLSSFGILPVHSQLCYESEIPQLKNLSHIL
jgi:hypothetical protein